MDAFIEILKNCEVTTLFVVIGSLVIFNLILNKKFDKIDKHFDDVKTEIKRLDGDIKELRTSLNRMEGAFYSKECCMLKSNHNHAAE